jgi:hypothetical protein
VFFRLDDPLAVEEAVLRWRGGACDAHFLGVPQPGSNVRPFHWSYFCFVGSPGREFDRGTFTLDLEPLTTDTDPASALREATTPDSPAGTSRP